MYGKALSPCYEYFVRHNPKETAFELKAHALYRWLGRHRRETSPPGAGRAWWRASSCSPCANTPAMRRRPDRPEVYQRALRWCLDACQFDDGAHGMFGRDDKWVGQGAGAILLYTLLRQRQAIPDEMERAYRPKIEKSWR